MHQLLSKIISNIYSYMLWSSRLSSQNLHTSYQSHK